VDLRKRLPATRLPAPMAAGWGRGVEPTWLDGLLADWARFDVAAFQSMLPYWAGRHLPVSDLDEGVPGPVPTAVSLFGGEQVPFPKPPREMVARYVNLVRWAEYDRGGHFPAVAEPELLVDVLRDTFRSLR
jgi:hypothetical protein